VHVAEPHGTPTVGGSVGVAHVDVASAGASRVGPSIPASPGVASPPASRVDVPAATNAVLKCVTAPTAKAPCTVDAIGS
jgi:hypothetical protein